MQHLLPMIKVKSLQTKHNFDLKLRNIVLNKGTIMQYSVKAKSC